MIILTNIGVLVDHASTKLADFTFQTKSENENFPNGPKFGVCIRTNLHYIVPKGYIYGKEFADKSSSFPVSIPFLGCLRDNQTEPFTKALNTLRKHHSGLFNLPTGQGIFINLIYIN